MAIPDPNATRWPNVRCYKCHDRLPLSIVWVDSVKDVDDVVVLICWKCWQHAHDLEVEEKRLA